MSDTASPGRVEPSPIARTLLGVYVVVAFFALVWPLYAIVAERAPALVLGVPFGLVWHIGWIVATFLVMLLFERNHAAR